MLVAGRAAFFGRIASVLTCPQRIVGVVLSFAINPPTAERPLTPKLR